MKLELENVNDVLELWNELEKIGKHPKVFEKQSVLERDKEIDEVGKRFSEVQRWFLNEQARARFENYPEKFLKIDRLLDLLGQTVFAFTEIFKGQEMSK